MRKRFYIGAKNGKRELFKSLLIPTINTHPEYGYVIGPFRTKAAAQFMLVNTMLLNIATTERKRHEQR